MSVDKKAIQEMFNRVHETMLGLGAEMARAGVVITVAWPSETADGQDNQEVITGTNIASGRQGMIILSHIVHRLELVAKENGDGVTGEAMEQVGMIIDRAFGLTELRKEGEMLN